MAKLMCRGLHPPTVSHGILAALVLIALVGGNAEGRNVVSEDRVEKELKPAFDVDEEGEADWKIYRPEHFHKNELCAILKCAEEELCMVQSNSANCITKTDVAALKAKVAKVMEIASDPKPHDSENEDHHRHIKRKFQEYAETLRKKQRNKVLQEADGDSETGKEKYLPAKKVHRHEPDNACTQQQLVAIEARLFSWFHELRAQSTAPDPAVFPRHTIPCHPDTLWMFVRLDGNQNQAISLEELRKLERPDSKACIEPFLDRCDLNKDEMLSLDEWCDCFRWAGKEKEEPPCHAARRMRDPHMLGAFIPECDIEGYYKFKQCHEGFCWCVDKWGREFDSSRVRGQPDCGQYADL